jgi:hypothetical protein
MLATQRILKMQEIDQKNTQKNVEQLDKIFYDKLAEMLYEYLKL